jgi:hypothetical protein
MAMIMVLMLKPAVLVFILSVGLALGLIVLDASGKVHIKWIVLARIWAGVRMVNTNPQFFGQTGSANTPIHGSLRISASPFVANERAPNVWSSPGDDTAGGEEKACARASEGVTKRLKSNAYFL